MCVEGFFFLNEKNNAKARSDTGIFFKSRVERRAHLGSFLLSGKNVNCSDENELHFGFGVLEPEAEDAADEESVGYFHVVDTENLVGDDGNDIDNYSSVQQGKNSNERGGGKGSNTPLK